MPTLHKNGRSDDDGKVLLFEFRQSRAMFALSSSLIFCGEYILCRPSLGLREEVGERSFLIPLLFLSASLPRVVSPLRQARLLKALSLSPSFTAPHSEGSVIIRIWIFHPPLMIHSSFVVELCGISLGTREQNFTGLLHAVCFIRDNFIRDIHSGCMTFWHFLIQKQTRKLNFL